MALIEKHLDTEKKPIEAKKAQEVQYDMPYSHEEEEHVELDVIEQLKANINHLEDLQKRLKFMNTELFTIVAPKK